MTSTDPGTASIDSQVYTGNIQI